MPTLFVILWEIARGHDKLKPATGSVGDGERATAMQVPRLGNWVIERELGHGGMGRVYLARREPPAEGLPDQAAVKVLAPELAREEGFLFRFQREINALASLDHPNIVRFYEAGEQGGRHFYAMEYVAGRNFDQILRERGRLPWPEVLDLALQVCPALKHAHDHGIIHRDLKTQNLLRADDGVVKLTDFGVAKVFASRHLTVTGGLVGTAEYISPEQAAGKPVTPRSDLYSLGVVLYTLLTGREPFQGDTVLDLMQKHRYAQCDPPKRIVEDLPPLLDALVCSLLEKDPAKRPANAQVLQRQLESCRRKLERKEQPTVDTGAGEATKVDGAAPPDKGPGPATLISRLVRGELERQQARGPIAEFFNRPVVVVASFALCVGLLVWGLWPPSAAALFEHGARLMRSEDATDWEAAWEKYFDQLERKYPDHPYGEQLQEFRQRLDDAKAERQARGPGGSASEAQRFYAVGRRLRGQGDLVAAEQIWQDLVTTFQGVESEQRWVRLTEKGLAALRDKLPPAEHRWDSVREALQRSRQLPRDQAEKVWSAIESLYRNDRSADPVLREVRQLRGGK